MVTATPALLFGRRWRLVWAARAWTVVLVGWAAVAAAGQGWLGPIVPVPDLLLAPSVAALALAAGVGMAAFERDLSGYRFGWRQMASLVATVAVVVALLPVLGSAFGGRWDLPQRDFDDKLAFMTEERNAEPFRVLWVSEADLLPLAGWPLDAPSLGTPPLDTPTLDSLSLGSGGASSDSPLLVWGTTDNGLPSPANLFTVAPLSGTRQLAEALALAASGDTDRLGSLLGPMGIRYVVVPQRLAPGSPDLSAPDLSAPDPSTPDPSMPDGVSTDGATSDAGTVASNGTPGTTTAGSATGAGDPAATSGLPAVVDLFSRQLDLSALPVGGDIRVWANTAWVPSRALFTDDQLASLPNDGPRAVAELSEGIGVLPDGEVGAAGVLSESGSVYVAQQFDDGWTFTTAVGDSSRNLAPTEVLGWAMRFDDVNDGPAAVGWTEPPLLRLLIVATPLLWLLALWLLIRNRPLAVATRTSIGGES